MSGSAKARGAGGRSWWRPANLGGGAVGLTVLALLAQACGGGERIEVRQTVPYGRQPAAVAKLPPGPAPVASAPAADSFGEDALLYRVGDSPCTILRAGLGGLAAGLCGEELSPRVYLRPDRPLRLAELISRYAPFELEEGDERVVFHGRGSEVAGSVEQRAMLEWARRLIAEADGMAGIRAYRLAFEWQRQLRGGQACEAVSVYLSGEALATTCDGLRATGIVPAARLGAILAWHDELLPFQAVRERRDGGDAVSTRLIVPGAGDARHDDDAVQSMIRFAETIHGELLAGDLAPAPEEERQRLAVLAPPQPPAAPRGEPGPVAPAEDATPEADAAELTLSEAITVGAEPAVAEEEDVDGPGDAGEAGAEDDETPPAAPPEPPPDAAADPVDG